MNKNHSWVEKISENNQEEMLNFLKNHENYSLFLLGNFANNGGQIGSSPYSGNYKLIRQGDAVVGVFCLFKNGTLLVQSTVREFDLILDACKEENIPVRGVLGEWDFSSALWQHLQKHSWIKKVSLESKEVLHQLDLTEIKVPLSPHVRVLTAADYPLWNPLRREYIKEMKYPISLSDEEMEKLFKSKVETHTVWGAFDKGQLVATADLNAKAFDLGQVGGVYTASPYRQSGIAKSLLHKLMQDSKELHGIRKLLVFTGETNAPARKLYTSLGAKPVGSFALLFGS